MPAGWDHRLHKRSLGIGQIARVPKVIALCRTALFRLPHRALPEESSAKQGITSDSSDSRILGSALCAQDDLSRDRGGAETGARVEADHAIVCVMRNYYAARLRPRDCGVQ